MSIPLPVRLFIVHIFVSKLNMYLQNTFTRVVSPFSPICGMRHPQSRPLVPLPPAHLKPFSLEVLL